MFRHILTTALSAGLLAAPALAEQHEGEDMEAAAGATPAATADVSNADGTAIGTVTINDTASGTALLVVSLTDLPEGAHGIHLHETGDCGADDFSSAGGHIAGDADHGINAEGGPHPGDLPNAIIGPDGALNVEIFAADLRIEEMIFDDDGAAFIVHSEADDYTSQPSGAAGDRIACGVFEEG